MAEQLIATMSDKWQPEEWKDEYREAMMKLIEEKVAKPGKEPGAAKTPGRKATNVVDLVSVLQESLNAQGKGTPRAKKSAKPRAGQSHRKAA